MALYSSASPANDQTALTGFASLALHKAPDAHARVANARFEHLRECCTSTTACTSSRSIMPTDLHCGNRLGLALNLSSDSAFRGVLDVPNDADFFCFFYGASSEENALNLTANARAEANAFVDLKSESVRPSAQTLPDTSNLKAL